MAQEPKFCLAYEVHRAGWATAVVSEGETEYKFSVSYLHDSLGELADSALALGRGALEAKVSFFDEPGEVQLKLIRENQHLKVALHKYSDWISWGKGSYKFELIAEFNTTVERFMHQVNQVLWKINHELGPEQYKTLWVQHDFPLQQYTLLQKGQTK